MEIDLLSSVCLLLLLTSTNAVQPPSNVEIDYAEKVLEITWDSVAGASGYNIYTATLPEQPKKKRTLINNKLITSGMRFTYLWHHEGGKKVRKIKGYRHFISVTAVCSTSLGVIKSPFSSEVNNLYFAGYSNMLCAKQIKSALVDSQAIDTIAVQWNPCKAADFIAFMESSGVKLAEMIGDSIDALQTGACSPIATLVVMLLKENGIDAYKAEGSFIKEYHAFVLLNIEGVEYVLDFSANQFLPDVSPVLIPRARCFIGKQGKLAAKGTPVYQIGKMYSPEQCRLLENSETEIYWNMYNECR